MEQRSGHSVMEDNTIKQDNSNNQEKYNEYDEKVTAKMFANSHYNHEKLKCPIEEQVQNKNILHI